MLADFGYGILVVTFFMALYAIGAAVFGYFNKSMAQIESARRAMLLTFPLLTIAAASLIGLPVGNTITKLSMNASSIGPCRP